MITTLTSFFSFEGYLNLAPSFLFLCYSLRNIWISLRTSLSLEIGVILTISGLKVDEMVFTLSISRIVFSTMRVMMKYSKGVDSTSRHNLYL